MNNRETSFTRFRDWNGVTKLVVGVVASGAMALVVGLALFWAYASPEDDVIGNGKGNCRLRDHTPIANDRGVVAVLREADCPYEMSQSSTYYIVFVHKADEPNETPPKSHAAGSHTK